MGKSLTDVGSMIWLAALAVSPMVATPGLAQAPGRNTPREVWVAIRSGISDADGKAGTGTVTDPFDGGTVEKLNGLFVKFKGEYGDNLTIHFGPGVFEGDRTWQPANNWKIRGAGMDITIFRTRADPNATETVGFRDGGYTGGPVGFEISDVTFDFNALNLRRPNRAFVWPRGNGYQVSYVHVDTLPEWSAETAYERGQKVRSRGVGSAGGAGFAAGAEFIALKGSKGQQPAPGEFWSALRPYQAGNLPAWDAAREYGLGEAVAKERRGYLCVAAGKGNDPAGDTAHWEAMSPDATDPDIYTTGVFVHAQPPGGGHRATRVKAINGNGSWFYGREAFLIGLGGNDCAIEDCVVDQFRGDYATLMVVTFGQHGVIRGCTVRGSGTPTVQAYGGWACYDTVFEDNFCADIGSATNIDSLNCRNVTFRGNVFMNCHYVGILVNVGGNVIENHRQYSMVIEGQPIQDFARSCMDGLFIYDNLVQMSDGAPFGAIQAQQRGLRNVRIFNNVLRTTSGHGRARAIGVLEAENATVHDNLCEPGMYCEALPPAATWYGNVDLLGAPMKDAQGRPIAARLPAVVPPEK